MKQKNYQNKWSHVFKTHILFVFCFSMAGCTYVPDFRMMGSNFKPMQSEIAEIAVPMPANAEKKSDEPPLFCKVSAGSARFGKQWYNFSTQTFELPFSGRASVELHPEHATGTMSFQSYVDHEGQKMIFCPVVDGAPNTKIACSSIYALDEDLKEGIKRTFDIPNAVRGGEIACAVNQEALARFR